MSSTGGLSPSPETYGGDRTLARIFDSVRASRGTAYSTDPNSLVDAENEAIARVLFVAWRQNRRFRNNFDPLRCTDSLPRWERIFALVPEPGASLAQRRAGVASAWARFGMRATRQTLVDVLTKALGPAFVSLSTVDPSLAITYWPAGTTVAGADWTSNVARLNIRVAVPSGYSLGQFLALIARIGPAIDPLIPAWMDWQWFVVSAQGAGFYLNDDPNLGFEAFDT
jgi:hypothetical protein